MSIYPVGSECDWDVEGMFELGRVMLIETLNRIQLCLNIYIHPHSLSLK